jgi:hypothetical protein
MHRRVTSGGPTSALSQTRRMWNVANKNLPRCSLDLGMALQAQIRITFDQELSIYRPMRVVTHRATFPQRLMLEYKWPRLLAMTLGAILVQPRHRQSGRQSGWRGTRSLEYVSAMRIVALNAIHMTFQHQMVLRHSKFRLRLQMALKTSGRIFSWIHNEFAPPAACFDMLAARPMT